jgi:hypothetical protein
MNTGEQHSGKSLGLTDDLHFTTERLRFRLNYRVIFKTTLCTPHSTIRQRATFWSYGDIPCTFHYAFPALWTFGIDLYHR